MNEKSWMKDLHHEDTRAPQNSGEETAYTVYRGDFLRMPELDFDTLAAADQDLRALYN